ncbi:MAG TPA: hypothetical protein VKY74_04185, partial [Chloroflexia bacterium]|nr:hypothetical protein [Chloroflexia bacterium]
PRVRYTFPDTATIASQLRPLAAGKMPADATTAITNSPWGPYIESLQIVGPDAGSYQAPLPSGADLQLQFDPAEATPSGPPR